MQEEVAKPPLQRSYQCAHSDDEHALTWCTPELQKAVESGYEIQYIYEVWQFDQTCAGLFQDYVNTWLKIKQEASGWATTKPNTNSTSTSTTSTRASNWSTTRSSTIRVCALWPK